MPAVPSHLIYYDIGATRLRAKVAKRIRGAGGVRLQRSVWWLRARQREVEALRREVEILWRGACATDSCIFTAVSDAQVSTSVQLGARVPVEAIIEGTRLVL